MELNPRSHGHNKIYYLLMQNNDIQKSRDPVLVCFLCVLGYQLMKSQDKSWNKNLDHIDIINLLSSTAE